MTEANEPPEHSAISKAETMALLEEAEAEAAEAEALATAARARARVARLRREALAEAEKAETAEAEETAETAETADKQPPDAEEGVDDTVENPDAETDEKAPEETIEAV